MRYYFVGTNGRQFGPYDIEILKEYIQQGRIVNNSTLKDEAGNVFRADAVFPDLFSSNVLNIELNDSISDDLSDIIIDFNNIPSNVEDFNNDSGTGLSARLPSDLEGLNWGAFFLSVPWCIYHKIMFGIFLKGSIFSFLFLVKGNELAWQYRYFESKEEFKTVQEKWFRWAMTVEVTFAVTLILIVIAFIIMIQKNGGFTSIMDVFNTYKLLLKD